MTAFRCLAWETCLFRNVSKLGTQKIGWRILRETKTHLLGCPGKEVKIKGYSNSSGFFHPHLSHLEGVPQPYLGDETDHHGDQPMVNSRKFKSTSHFVPGIFDPWIIRKKSARNCLVNWASSVYPYRLPNTWWGDITGPKKQTSPSQEVFGR